MQMLSKNVLFVISFTEIFKILETMTLQLAHDQIW